MKQKELSEEFHELLESRQKGSFLVDIMYEAMISVSTYLEIAWTLAVDLFDQEANPEHAFKIVELFIKESEKNERLIKEIEKFKTQKRIS